MTRRPSLETEELQPARFSVASENDALDLLKKHEPFLKEPLDGQASRHHRYRACYLTRV